MLRRLAAILVLALGPGACAYQVEVAAPPVGATSTKVFAADGTLITTIHAEQDREEVALGDISPRLQQAVVAIEDARFFNHKGVDLRALARALQRNAAAGRVTEGGSTITQQYVKNVLLDPSQNLDRKLKEAVLAFQLERKYTKETILERYLNRIYFGNGAYGVQAASTLYFAKPAATLALPESALLAGLIAAPERYDPFDHPESAKARRDVVLERMRELMIVPEADVAAAKAAPVGVVDRPAVEHYPAGHFVERVKRFVLDDARFGATAAERRRALFEGGLRIHTALDLDIQAKAEEAVASVLAAGGAPGARGVPGNDGARGVPGNDEARGVPGNDGPAGAMVILDPANGYVRALVGGRDFFGRTPEAKFDLATQGMRQSGSSFKPFVLAAALDRGIPLEKVLDAPGSLNVPMPDGQPDWVVENYEGSGGPPTNLTEATVASVNTVYAQLITEVGPQAAVDMARALGVRSDLKPYPSAVLGTNEVTVLDMASAYGTFAADGMHADPVLVTEITRADGSVLYRRPSTRSRVVRPDVARKVTSVLGEVINRGTGVRAQIGRPAAGKTGTAQQWRDAWFVGYTPDLVGAVWVGFPDRLRSMTPPATPVKVTGGSWPAEIWQRAMSSALAAVPPNLFPPLEPEAPPAEPPPPSSVAVPEVGGLPEAEARARLEAAGLVMASEPRTSRDQAAGAVVEQSPGAGALAAPGSTVTVSVSTGPPRAVSVPAVLGRTVDEVVRALQEAGLVAEVVVAEPDDGMSTRPGRVWKQEPSAGTTLDEGQQVRVFARR
ncbi:MAG: PBP1A family penicillin-binding protein [Actinomycetota bacterium]|nr:PBP1A family penicillin-binding protein [Actinomycetota bacterium]